MAFHPYLFFGGNCAEAFTRYQEVFGGEVFIMRGKDVPDSPPEFADAVMHAALSFDGHMLMGSDDPTADPFGPVQAMMVSYNTATVEDANEKFAALAEGGTVTQALAAEFFSPAFGMVTDSFGTPWMIVADDPSQPTLG